jgi:enamine deaminase RidA (YjgF/YER057c/UK114 family)
MNKVIASPYAPKAVGPYSQAIQAEGTLYLSGQLPIDGATGTMPRLLRSRQSRVLKMLVTYSRRQVMTTQMLSRPPFCLPTLRILQQ